MLRRSAVVFLLILIVTPPAVFSQSSAEGAGGTAEVQEAEPYSEDEFPPWLLKIRRGEVILIGSFPFTMFVTNIGAQLYRYASNDFDQIYAPSVFGGIQQSDYTDEEKRAVIITAVSISAAIALTDFIIGEILEKKAARNKK